MSFNVKKFKVVKTLIVNQLKYRYFFMYFITNNVLKKYINEK